MKRFVIVTLETHGEDATRKVAQALGRCFGQEIPRETLDDVGGLARVHGIEVQEGADEPDVCWSCGADLHGTEEE